ncbi:MAG TPA: hypothetical protein PKE45_10840, partial [Caldilineaceae bacterium]|nr:hypothetical protein [Caldilineaceae bacterium]
AVLRPRASYRWALAGVMSLLAIWTTGQRLDPKLFKIWYPIDEAQINIVDLYQRGRDGFPLFGDYQPIAMTPPPMMLTMPQPPESSRLPPASPPPNLTVQAENFARIQL